MVSNKEESRISGTYIRTLVKQLASSRTKDSNAMPPQDSSADISARPGDGSGESGKTQTPSHKKQVRRRLHTSRPYQERLLNMAEARREIVTALKQHRAAMRQASEQRQRQQTQTQPPPPPPPPSLQPQTLLLSEQESRHGSKTNAIPDYLMGPFSSCSSCAHPPPPPPPHLLQPPDPFLWSISNSHTTTNPPLNFLLPNQPLGLNLNFQDFNDIIQTSSSSSTTSSSSTSSSSSSICTNYPPIYSSPSSTSSPLEAVMTTTPLSSAVSAAAGLHQAVDEEEMARIRSIGEKHQIEWNDTVNLVTSAWWFEFLKTVEPPEQPPEIKAEMEDDVFRPFDDVIQFPSWLNPTEDFDLFQPYLSDYSSPDDPALSCMEIGEIEGMDGEWLA